MSKSYIGVTGFLELQKNRLVDYLAGIEGGYTPEEVHQMIGAGYNAACALNLMGLCPNDELQTIGMLVTQLLRGGE